MSGDVQPRKRKDKRKKKDGDRAKAEAEFLARKLSAAADDSDEGFSVKPPQPAAHSAPSFAEGDSVIHVDHEGGTGGHWCAKIVFFILLAVLIGLIGLIIAENRGLEDADTPIAESRFSQVFDGWVDEGPIHDDHHDEHTLELNHPGEEEEHDDDDDHHEFHDEIEDIESEIEGNDEDDREEDNGHDERDENDDDALSKEDESDGINEASDEEVDPVNENEEDEDDDDDDNPREDEGGEDEDDDIDEADFNDLEENEYLSQEDLADESNEADNDVDEYLSRSAEREYNKNSAEFYDNENDQDPLEEVDSVEEDIVDNEAVEEEHLAAKKAEKLAEEENSDNTSDDDETVEIERNRRMTLIDNEIIEGPVIEEKVEKTTVKKVEAQKPISKNTYEKEDEEEMEFLHKKISSMVFNEPAVISEPSEEEIEYDDDKVEDVKEILDDHDQEPEVIEKSELMEDDNDEIDEEEPEEEELLEEELVEEEEDIEEDLSEELDDTELMKKLEEKYGKLPELDDEPEGRSDDEKPVVPARRKPKPSGGNSVEEEPEDWTDDDNAEWHQQLNLAQAEMDEGKFDDALRHFTALTLTYPSCWRAKLGRAKVLDELAHIKQSNNILQSAINTYREVLNMNITDKVYAKIANKVIDRIRFRGNHMEAIQIQKILVKKFPQDPEHRNEMAISYLMVNKPNAARAILKETLDLWPNNGVALVHYGFILKTIDNNLEDGVLYLLKGVETKENGTLDGRFLYHLGDALARLGRKDEASKIYEQGASLKVFLSAQQRSLYNIDRLTGRPWWEPEQTPYHKFVKVLEANWEKISQEAEKLRSNYKPENENLKDTGDWSQFELFARGFEIKENCARCPITCGIVRSEPAARGCRRGQIKFSAMSPGTHVHAHTGPTNCRLRAHLGLQGTSNTFIRVGNEIRQWEQGRVFIFDDSFEHEVWHNGTVIRIVLIIDFWHPELTNEERISLPAI